MKYLFFDIECVDGRRGICEYGYVLTDESFNVIKQRNILIDPECPFNLVNRRGEVDLVLTYSPDEYAKFYPFDDSYETIKKLMTQEDILIFGHAVSNDIRYIVKACNRYNLPLFDYTAYDIQNMLPVFNKENKKYTSLEKAFADIVPLQIRRELKDHRACDDAMKTMLVLESMVMDLGFSVYDLIDACPSCKFNALEYWDQMRAKRKAKKLLLKKQATRSKGQIMWNDLYRENKQLLENPNYIGKIVVISAKMKEHDEELVSLIQVMKDNDYIAFNKINRSDYLVAFDEENKKEITSGLKHPFAGEILTYQEFIELNNH